MSFFGCWVPTNAGCFLPNLQNTKSTKVQIRYLVYCIENAILNLPSDQEQMVWLIDFNGINLSNISIKVTKEIAHVLQDHYPERLGLAILYNPPKFFEPFWNVSLILLLKICNILNMSYAPSKQIRRIFSKLMLPERKVFVLYHESIFCHVCCFWFIPLDAHLIIVTLGPQDHWILSNSQCLILRLIWLL